MDNGQYLKEKDFNDSLSYKEFVDLCENLVAEDKTTGPGQTENHIKFTKLNYHRLKRITKTLELDFDTLVAFRNIEENLVWIVLVEAWCGDVAQNLPYIHAMSQLSDKILLRIILKNKHPEIMKHFLTNGTESIPKLICVHKSTEKVLWTWGSRPIDAQKMFVDYKHNPNMTKSEALENIQRWYISNRGKLIQEEFRNLLVDCQKILRKKEKEEIF